MAALTSSPLGLTTPPRKMVIGVAATRTPTSTTRLRDQCSAAMTARPMKIDDSSALTSRIR